MDSPITAFILFVLILLFGRHKTRPPADKNNKGLPFHIRGQTWYLKPAEIDKLGPFIDQGEDLFVHADILKTYQGCRVSKKAGLIFKKYWPKGGWDKIRFVFRPLRTRRAFLLSDNLIDCGLPTPPVLGWSASRLGQNQYEAMLVAEIQNAEPLTNWLEKKSDDSTTRLRVMEAYGKLAATFHQHGYSNRDLKHENVMCLKEKPWVLWVVDLDGVKKLPFINRRRAGRDLMRVGKSLASLGWTNKAEIDAFFKAYNSQVPARLCCYAFPRQ